MNENICAICGEAHDELFELNGQQVCESCAEESGYIRCADCDEWVREDDTFETCTGERICRDCFENDYIVCEDCGDVIPCDDACPVIVDRYGNEGYVCESCRDDNYEFCEHCENYVRNDQIWASDCDRSICYECSDYYRVCYDCDRIIHESDAYYDEDEGEYYCESCYNRYHSSVIHNYSYKPDADFKLRSSEIKLAEKKNYNPLATTFTYGIELEVDKGENPNALAGEIADLNMPLYMKHDGSLSSVGIEIVTHPCSLDFHRYDLRWSEISRLCRKHKYTSHKAGTCGLHIHVGRRQMGEDSSARQVTAGNLVLLTYALWNELVRFSRRNEEQLNSWANKPYLPCLDGNAHLTDGELTSAALSTRNRGRYQAVNLCNCETVEFRIFRGTLKRDTLIASIELVHNMTKFAMTHTPTECSTANWADVIGVEEFKELKEYCVARGL